MSASSTVRSCTDAVDIAAAIKGLGLMNRELTDMSEACDHLRALREAVEYEANSMRHTVDSWRQAKQRGAGVSWDLLGT